MRIYPRHELAAQKARDLQKVRDIIETTGDRSVDAGTRLTRNTAADARVLRMIPVCAEGVGGTVPGTDPLAELLRRERQRERTEQRLTSSERPNAVVL